MKLLNTDSKLQLVIFDLDGVLVDACEWHRVAFNQALREISDYEISEQEHIEIYNGLPTAKKLDMLNLKGIVNINDNSLIHNRKQQITMDLINEGLRPDLSKIELMKWLKDRKYNICCFTNSISRTASLMLEKCGVLNYLHTVVTNEDVKNPKPSPEGYNNLINKYKVNPRQCMIVEDSPKGVAAAVDSGAIVMKVKNATEVTKDNLERFINENFDSNGW